MNALIYLERWRERQLSQYLEAQIIDQLDQQRVLHEYQQAQTIERLDQQNASLSLLGSILADTDASVGLIQADIARLLAVTNRALPVIIDHLALVGARLAHIEQLLASPEETRAWELFRSGSHALASAVEMSEKGSKGLSDDWLDEAISDLSGAVHTYKYRPEFWFQLGLAHAHRGSAEDAAEAFTCSARYAVSASPGFAAESVLLAAAHFRGSGQQTKAKDILHKFLPPLERCAEIHLNLAMHHGEPDQFTRALELAPLLALTALGALKEARRTDDIILLEEAAGKVCRDENGPVSRLRTLEETIRDLAEAVTEVGLNPLSDPLVAVELPDFGVKALLKAEKSIRFAVKRGTEFAGDVRSGLEQLEDHAQDCRRRHQDAITSGSKQIGEAQQQAAEAKKRTQQVSADRLAKAEQQKDDAERAYREAKDYLQDTISKAAEAQRRLEIYTQIYDESGKLREGQLKRLREIWRTSGSEDFRKTGDFYDLVSWHCNHRYGGHDNFIDWAWEHKERRHYWQNIRYVDAVGRWAFGKPNDYWTISPVRGRYTDIPSYDRDFPWYYVVFAEIVLHMIGEEGDKIQAEPEEAKKDIEYAKAHVDTAHRSVRRQTEIVDGVRQRRARGEVPRDLQHAEQEAERRCHQIVQQVEDRVRNAELEYRKAHEASRYAAEAISDILRILDTVIEDSTASRNRIIPSI